MITLIKGRDDVIFDSTLPLSEHNLGILINAMKICLRHQELYLSYSIHNYVPLVVAHYWSGKPVFECSFRPMHESHNSLSESLKHDQSNSELVTGCRKLTQQLNAKIIK